MPYALVLFDLDGTLIDPTVGITKSVQYALNHFGISEDPANLRHFIGPPLPYSFATTYGFDETQAWEAVAKYREYFAAQGMYESLVYPGIPALLAALQAAGQQAAVVTAKPAHFAVPIIAHFGLAPYFGQIIGPDLNLANADKALLIGEALRHYPAIAPEQVVMVGDRKHDILGAQARAIDSIGVTYGAGTAEEIAAAQPTYQVASVAALAALLRGQEPMP